MSKNDNLNGTIPPLRKIRQRESAVPKQRYRRYQIADIITNPLEIANAIKKDGKKYVGVQDVLGNYFRLLYNTVGYLHEQKWIDKDDRYTYAKMIRSQMSDFEELLLFYNSISDFGMDWEYNGQTDKRLITDYQLIKNIPTHIEDARSFYPQIEYEKL